MVSQAVAGPAVDPAVAQDYAAIWSEHIRGAVKEFLKTAVVIDNQPWVQEITSSTAANAAPPTDSGLGDEVSALSEPTAEEVAIATEEEKNRHNLNIRAISDVFASEGVACAFVLPDDRDIDTKQKINRAVSAAKVSDLVVIDWYLEPKSSSLTLKILEELATADSNENGRLRLICVYTGEPLGESILTDVMNKLGAGGVSFNKVEKEKYYAAGDHAIIKIINKSETPAEKLPHELISLFSDLADGLVPAFALAAVGAIRKNAHHMLTRFGKLLDTAYIANRIITDPPSDVSEMMRDLFVAECDSAIGLEAVADRYLDTEGITKWINTNSSEIQTQKKGETVIDTAVLLKLLNEGIKAEVPMGSGRKKVPSKHHILVSSALAGADNDHKKSEYEFARLAALKREAYGRSRLFSDKGWRPSLTTGTIVMYTPSSGHNDGVPEYLICLTPSCDTLRLAGETPFVFLRTKVNEDKYGMVLREKNGNDTLIRIDPKRPFIRTFMFSPKDHNHHHRILANQSDDSTSDFKFKSSEGDELLWLGEVRHIRAASEMTSLLQGWMRIGISDSEYMRISSKENT